MTILYEIIVTYFKVKKKVIFCTQQIFKLLKKK